MSMTQPKQRTQYWWTAEQLEAAGWERYGYGNNRVVHCWWRHDGEVVLQEHGGAWLTEPPPPPELSDERIGELLAAMRYWVGHDGCHLNWTRWALRALESAVAYVRAERDRAHGKATTGAVMRHLEDLRNAVSGRVT